MKRTTITMAATLAGLLAAPSLASAAVTAITAEPVSLRAGPALDFPVVDQIPDDARVTVFGCVRAYQWCDIAWRDARGWVRGDDLSYLYQQRRVRLIEYGPRIGLPVVVFSFDSYWDRYYRGRPFYTERTRWRTTWRNHDGVRGKARVNVERDRSDTTKTERRTDRIDRQKDRNDRRMDRKDDRSERGLKQGAKQGMKKTTGPTGRRATHVPIATSRKPKCASGRLVRLRVLPSNVANAVVSAAVRQRVRAAGAMAAAPVAAAMARRIATNL